VCALMPENHGVEVCTQMEKDIFSWVKKYVVIGHLRYCSAIFL